MTDIRGSHWEGCWREHHDCAIAEIERLQAKLREYEAWERDINQALNSGDGSYRP